MRRRELLEPEEQRRAARAAAAEQHGDAPGFERPHDPPFDSRPFHDHSKKLRAKKTVERLIRTAEPRAETATLKKGPVGVNRQTRVREVRQGIMADGMNLCVLGAQWGDEGKGKIVDLLTPHFSVVARYQGGHNAGHTVYTQGRKFVLHLLPSGILHPGITCVIGNGLVVDPAALFKEIDEILAAGIDISGRVLVSDRAHVILPYHREIDVLSEARRGERKIGTTSRGIGPAYEDKIARRGVRVGDLADTSDDGPLAHAIRENVAARNRLVGDAAMNWENVLADARRCWPRLEPLVTDTSVFLHRAIQAGQRVMFEGAQGTLLDVDHGTYPFVTSSNATAGGAATGLGVGPRAVGQVLGVAKAYTTRVGEGPLPTELFGDMGERLRETGQEYGASTGRPRRCGWFDAVAVRYAVRVNGIDALALTKLDVLDGVEAIEVCTAYTNGKGTLTEMPADTAQLAACTPIYETMPGWSKPTRGLTRFADLPIEAQRYIRKLEEITGVPAAVVSTGSDRAHTIVREDSIASGWM
jgi:adenylosuccinate synthase